MRLVVPLIALALLAACSDKESTAELNSTPAPAMADAASNTAGSDVAR